MEHGGNKRLDRRASDAAAAAADDRGGEEGVVDDVVPEDKRLSMLNPPPMPLPPTATLRSRYSLYASIWCIVDHLDLRTPQLLILALRLVLHDG